MAAENEGRIKAVEGELGLLKNQIQQTLLDIREHVLELTNPFGSGSRPARDWSSRPAASAEPAPMVTVVAPPAFPAGSEQVVESQVVETIEPPAPPEPRPEPEAQATPGLDSFDALFDAPAAPGLENPASSAPENAWDEPPAHAPEPMRSVSSPRDHHQPQPPVSAPASAPEPPMDKGSKIDLITLTSMVKWVDQTTRRIGKERVMVILDIYEMAGRITPATKQVVQRLCALTDGSSEESIPLRDVVGAMLQIDGLLEAKQADERRLLGLLVDDSFDPFQGLISSRNGNH
ncbi:MAG: hypothetical protein HYY34_01530 [Chloroflexi bacterium]|nr:hypothetical protein [Chloroflexota bacterium]